LDRYQKEAGERPVSSDVAMVGLHLEVNIPMAPMTSIFEGQRAKTRPFPTKTRVVWVLGTYI